MALELRPLTLPELLDRSFSTYKRHLWTFVGIMAVPAGAATLYAVIAQFFNTQAEPPTTPEAIVWSAVPIVIAALIFTVLYLITYAFALGATTMAVAQIYKGAPASVGGAYREVRRHARRLVLLLLWGSLRVGGVWLGAVALTGVFAAILAMGSRILSGLIFLLGMIGAIFLALFFMVRYGVSVPAVVLEDLKAGQALSRSVDLTEDHRWRVFLMILCAVVINYATTLLLQGPFLVGAIVAGPGTTTAITLSIIGAVIGGIGGMFTGPIMIIGLAMMYYDLRIRKEALDLHMMLEALDAPRG
jgi:MFS family permease